MQCLGRLSGLGLLVVLGCGGANPAPPKPASPPSSAVAKEPVEKADLSPVPAPADLFLVGRLKRPGPIADTIARWAGLPLTPRTFIAQELPALEAVVAWDAPVELAVALPRSGRRHGVRTVVSVGLNSLGGMLSAVRERGLTPERVLPEIFGFAGPQGAHCMLGPAVGSVNARLVCGDSASDVEELFPYATRGLPNENLGARDLELELRVEPIRRRYSSEIAGARLLAGFFLRQVELDSPRFDRALADATYAGADELVAWVEDTDSMKLEGTVDDTGQKLALDFSWKFRSTRSWLGRFTQEMSRRPAAPPPAFARLPAEATGGGYAVDARSELSTPIRTALLELADAYLEHEKIGKPGREKVRVLLTDFMKSWGFGYAKAKGNLPPDAKASDTERAFGWYLTRADMKSSEVDRMLGELDAVVRDRELWKVLAKRLDLDPKAQVKSRIVPLKAKGVPAGARALVLTVPAGLSDRLRKKEGSTTKVGKDTNTFVLGVCPDGTDGALMVASTDEKDAAERLRTYFAEGTKRFAERADLEPIRSNRALFAEFFTLVGLFDTLSSGSAGVAAKLPNHGETPIFWSATSAAGPPLTLSASVSVPAAALADMPGLTAEFLSSL